MRSVWPGSLFKKYEQATGIPKVPRTASIPGQTYRAARYPRPSTPSIRATSGPLISSTICPPSPVIMLCAVARNKLFDLIFMNRFRIYFITDKLSVSKRSTIQQINSIAKGFQNFPAVLLLLIPMECDEQLSMLFA